MDALDAKNSVGVPRPLGQLTAGRGLAAVLPPNPNPKRHRRRVFLPILGDDDQLAAALGLRDLHTARDLGDDRLALGFARLEEFLNPRQALGDVKTGHAPGVERAHRQLRAGLANRLGGDNADRLADLHLLARRQVATVTLRAHTVPAFAGQHGAHHDRFDAGLFDLVGSVLGDILIGLDDDLAAARGDDVLHGDPPDDAIFEGNDHVVAFLDRHHRHALGGLAVLITDDDVLCDVHQPARQVAGLRRTDGGVGQTLALAVGGDEVLG